MKVVVIGKSSEDLDTGCSGTLSRLQKEGHQVYVIAALKKNSWNKKTIQGFQNLANKIGTNNISYTDDFDFSAVSQYNINSLRKLIEPIKATIVFFPSKVSPDSKLRVLAESALITCRDVENVLMYETSKNKNFTPNIFFDVESNGNFRNKDKKALAIHRFYAQKAKIRRGNKEAFSSHRTILLTDYLFGDVHN